VDHEAARTTSIGGGATRLTRRHSEAHHQFVFPSQGLLATY